MNFFPSLVSNETLRKPALRSRAWPWNNIDEMLEWTGKWPFMGERHLGMLPLDVEEKEKEYIVKVNVPGIPKEFIDVTFEGHVLTIFVKELKQEKKEEKNFLFKERYEGISSRSIELPLAMADAPIDAKLREGVLTLVLKKHLATSSVKIKVE